MTTKLLEPCKQLIIDKLGITLNSNEINSYIQKATIQLGITGYKSYSKDLQKSILNSVLQNVQNDNSLESVVSTLENIRNQPVIHIPNEQDNDYSETQEIEPMSNFEKNNNYPINFSIQPTYFKTQLININANSVVTKLPNNSKIVPFKIICNKPLPMIITMKIDQDYRCHFYKSSENTWDVITDMEPYVNTFNNSKITLTFYNGTKMNCLLDLHTTSEETIRDITKIDNNHYNIVLSQPNVHKYDIKIQNGNSYINMYYVDNDAYISDKDLDLNQIKGRNLKFIYMTEQLHLLLKYKEK